MHRNFHFHAKYEYEYGILDPDACVYDAGMKYEYIMIIDHDACIYDAFFFCYERTDKAILGVG